MSLPGLLACKGRNQAYRITVAKHDVWNHRLLHCFSTVCFDVHQRKHQSFVLLVLCEGNPPVTGGFPSQKASNAESISMRWCHHVAPRYPATLIRIVSVCNMLRHHLHICMGVGVGMSQMYSCFDQQSCVKGSYYHLSIYNHKYSDLTWNRITCSLFMKNNSSRLISKLVFGIRWCIYKQIIVKYFLILQHVSHSLTN